MRDKRPLPIFAERFAGERIKRGMSQADFAEFVGIARPTVGFYENRERLPDAFVLRQIAERCGVSTDYLVGLSDISSTDIEVQRVGRHVGLTEKNLKKLLQNRDNKAFNLFISKTIEFVTDDFFNALELSALSEQWFTGPRFEMPEGRGSAEARFANLIAGEIITLSYADIVDFYKQRYEKFMGQFSDRIFYCFLKRLSYSKNGEDLTISVDIEGEEEWENAALRAIFGKGQMDAGRPDIQSRASEKASMGKRKKKSDKS